MEKLSTFSNQFSVFHNNMDARKQIMSSSSVNVAKIIAMGRSGTGGL